jgi:hypothetical protein
MTVKEAFLSDNNGIIPCRQCCLLTAGAIIIVMLLSQLPGILGLNWLDLAGVTGE